MRRAAALANFYILDFFFQNHLEQKNTHTKKMSAGLEAIQTTITRKLIFLKKKKKTATATTFRKVQNERTPCSKFCLNSAPVR